MEYRQLGRTGVEVSPLCLGAMMFGAWGNPDHEDSIRIIHRGARRRDQLRRHRRRLLRRRVGGDRRRRRSPAAATSVVLATKFHGRMGEGPNRGGNSRRWIIQEVEASLRRLQHRLDRPLPGAPPRAVRRHRRDARRAHRPRPRREDPLPRLLDVPAPTQIVEAQWTAERRGRERFVCEQPPYSLLVRGIERDVLPACERYGMGVIRGARSRAAGSRAATARAPELPASTRSDRHPAALRHVAPREPAQARGRRGARAARRGGRADPDPPRDRLRAPPPGRHLGDHRPADDGAAREPARRRRASSSRTSCSTGSTRSSRPGRT